jgi:hypothetical protein
LRDIAAVQQHVGIPGQSLAPAGDLRGTRRKRAGVEHARAQHHPAVGTVADQVDGGNVLALSQERGDLTDAVPLAVERHHFQPRCVSALSAQRVGQ